jgi:hypothetical protein
LGSDEGSYDSAKRYHGYHVGGRVAGMWGRVLDEQSQLNQGLVDAVGGLEGRRQPNSCAVRDQGAPDLPKALAVRLGIEGTGPWWESNTVAHRWGAVAHGSWTGGYPYLGGRVVPERLEGLEDQVCH